MQFARLYPLNQLDLPVEKKHVDFGPLMAPGTKIENPSRDYTPPSKPRLNGVVTSNIYTDSHDGLQRSTCSKHIHSSASDCFMNA